MAMNINIKMIIIKKLLFNLPVKDTSKKGHNETSQWVPYSEVPLYTCIYIYIFFSSLDCVTITRWLASLAITIVMMQYTTHTILQSSYHRDDVCDSIPNLSGRPGGS